MPDQAAGPPAGAPVHHPAPADAQANGQADTDHHVTLTERGPFLAPECRCGWYGPARRSRPLARLEAEAHLAATAPPEG